MEIRVNFVKENEGIWAVVADAPSLKAFAATEAEAIGLLLNAVEAHYQAKASSVQFVLEAKPKEVIQGPLANDALRALAAKHQPPASWFQEDQPVL